MRSKRRIEQGHDGKGRPCANKAVAHRTPESGDIRPRARGEERSERGESEQRGARLCRLHEARAGTGRDRPAGTSGGPPSPRTDEGGEGEGGQQRLLDEKAAVIYGGRRHGQKRRGGQRGPAAQRGCEGPKQEA